MIKGAEKIEMQKLPGIQEDMQRSTDSISTLVSEDLMLENFEAELFEDIRASIQKSSKAYNTTNANCKITSGESQAVTCKLATSSPIERQGRSSDSFLLVFILLQ